jgi:hypothetical protein
MEILYLCPYWGQEDSDASTFLARVLQEDYDGVEINLPESGEFADSFLSGLEGIRSARNNFTFAAQQVLSPANESVDAYRQRMKSRLEYLVSLNPLFINSHTGKDYFSFDDNCRLIEAAENISVRSGIPIFHETHRGRFTFHAASLLPYLERFPQIKLTGDFSHWCTVSESMLADQGWILEQVIPHVHHLHARIGQEHAPQVNDPFAPEWSEHFLVFMEWWKKIIDVNRSRRKSAFTITPEFGPVPYMPTLPYSQKPLSDQWTVNAKIKNVLKERFEISAIAKR